MKNRKGVLIMVVIIAFFAMYPPSVGQSTHTHKERQVKPTLYEVYITNLRLTKEIEIGIKKLETNLTQIKQKK
jgi:hypothetical protein